MSSRLGLAGAALCTLLVGCGQQPVAVPKDHFYRLSITPSASVVRAEKLEGVVQVDRFGADGLFQDRAIVYAHSDTPNVLHQYRYHFWTEAPTRMLQNVTVQYLRSAHLADQIVTPEHRTDASFTLSGDIRKLEHIVGNSSRVLVEIEYGLRRNSDGSLVWLKDYRVSKVIADEHVSGATQAISQAMSEILSELIADISSR